MCDYIDSCQGRPKAPPPRRRKIIGEQKRKKLGGKFQLMFMSKMIKNSPTRIFNSKNFPWPWGDTPEPR